MCKDTLFTGERALPVVFILPLMVEPFTSEYFMRQAIVEAQKARALNEVPVGAVLVVNNHIIARGHNSVEMLTDVTAHAEMIAITGAMHHFNAKYLPDCTLYVTLEPCPMCAGALRWSQIGKVVYGAADNKGGFMRFGREMLHPRTTLEYGVCADECAAMLKTFFAEKRASVR